MKALSFLGPTHHQTILQPVADRLAARGCDTAWYTANAEASFEVGIARGGPSWRWLPDYCNPQARDQMYDEQIPLWRDAYKEPGPVSLLLPPVTDRIVYEICSDWPATDALLQDYRPDRAYALHELNRWGMILGYWCAVHKIPYYTTQEGMYYATPWIYTGHTRYSTTLCWGEATKRLLLSVGCPPERVRVVGHPGLQKRWEQASTTAEKKRARESLPASWANSKITLLYIANVKISELNVDNLLRGLAASPYRMVIQCGNHMGIPARAAVRDWFRDHGDIAVLSEDESLLWAQADLAECVAIMGCSTFDLECLWRGKPLAELWSPGQPMNFGEKGLAAVGGDRSVVDWTNAALELHATDAYTRTVKDFVADEICNPDAAQEIADAIIAD